MLFRLLDSAFRTAAAIEKQQIFRVLVQVARAGFEHGDQIFFRLVFGVNVLEAFSQGGFFSALVSQISTSF